MKLTALVNGDVWTMDCARPKCQAVLIKGNKVIYSGESNAVIDLGKQHGTPEIIDLKGKTLLPGLIDAHQHMTWHARTLLQVNCSYPEVKSIRQIVSLLKTKQPDSTGWLQGYGYDDNKLMEKRHPTRWELDEVSKDVPIVLCHVSLHMVAVNSKALELVGITDNTPDPPDGKIVKGSDGKPSGLLLEGAQALVLYNIPTYSVAEMVEGLAKASARLVKLGITSIHDAGAGELGAVELEAYEKAHLNQKLKVRCNLFHPFYEPKKMSSILDNPDSVFNRMAQIESEWLRFRGAKFFLDGSLIGQTAAVRVPYKNSDGNCGFLVMAPEYLEQMVVIAHKKGLQIGIHAIGEVAVDTCAAVYAKVLQEYPRLNCRHRIEHCAMVTKQSLELIKKLEVVVATQPIFLDEFGDGFNNNLPKSELRKVYAYKSMLENGITVAFSSDNPVSSFDPLAGIKAAVNRRTQSGDVFEEQERVSLEDAVRCYTVNGAYTSFEEHIKGKISPDYLADMVILSGKLTTETLDEVTVEQTIIDGQLQ